MKWYYGVAYGRSSHLRRTVEVGKAVVNGPLFKSAVAGDLPNVFVAGKPANEGFNEKNIYKWWICHHY